MAFDVVFDGIEWSFEGDKNQQWGFESIYRLSNQT